MTNDQNKKPLNFVNNPEEANETKLQLAPIKNEESLTLIESRPLLTNDLQSDESSPQHSSNTGTISNNSTIFLKPVSQPENLSSVQNLSIEPTSTLEQLESELRKVVLKLYIQSTLPKPPPTATPVSRRVPS